MTWIVRCGTMCLFSLALASSPVLSQARWPITEVTRFGGSDEGLASFNDIRDLQIGTDGSIWMLDFQTQTLRRFAPDGSPIGQVARKGKGPGELANSNGFRRGPDGRMYVRDHSNARVSIFSPDGKVAGQHIYPSSSYGWRWEAAVDAKGRLHESTSVRRGEKYVPAIVRNAPDFASADTIDHPASCTDEPIPPAGIEGKNGFVGIPYAARPVYTFAADGAFWCGSSDAYRLRRFPFGATTHDLEITLDVPRIRVPKAERDSAIKGVEEFLTRIGGPLKPWDKDAVAHDRGPMMGFGSDEKGRLWVARETADGVTEFDVWNGSGARIAVVSPGVKLPSFPLFRVYGDRLAAVILDENELPTIVVYQFNER